MAMKKRSAPAKKKKTPSGRKGAKAAPGRPARKRAGPSGPKGVTARKRPARKAPARRGSAAPVVPEENPRALALARRVGTLVAEKKALDVVILDVRGMTSYADYFVIASGESDRQVAAMADHVHEVLKKEENSRPLGQEGTEGGQWVLLDYGEVVVHLFLGETRAFYDLEGLWADAPREKVA
jgi:ribosome-associated protein